MNLQKSPKTKYFSGYASPPRSWLREWNHFKNHCCIRARSPPSCGNVFYGSDLFIHFCLCHITELTDVDSAFGHW